MGCEPVTFDRCKGTREFTTHKCFGGLNSDSMHYEQYHSTVTGVQTFKLQELKLDSMIAYELNESLQEERT